MTRRPRGTAASVGALAFAFAFAFACGNPEPSPKPAALSGTVRANIVDTGPELSRPENIDGAALAASAEPRRGSSWRAEHEPPNVAPESPLLAVDDTCAEDSDCLAGVSLYITEQGSCCRGCRGEPENYDSSQARIDACLAANGGAARGQGCSTRRCSKPREVRCDAGHCVFTRG